MRKQPITPTAEDRMKADMKRSFTDGRLFFKILMFALPIMATSLLQILYNSADHIVVGQFSGDPEALAAVGCTSAFTNLMTNLMIGVATGTGVIAAQQFGARNTSGVSRTVHTAMASSIIIGVILMAIGLAIHRPVLSMIVSSASLLDKAALYVFIVFLGIPATSVYNFAASIMRSIGDSRTPLIILSATGILNVVLNILFVIAFHMSIAGVALATIISQYVSAAVAVTVLVRAKDECHGLRPRELKIEGGILRRMLAIGIPAGLQSSAYNIANMVIVAGVNTFERPYISANTVAGNIDSILYVCMVCFAQAAITATSQNLGAGKPDRIKRSLIYSVLLVIGIGGFIAGMILIFKIPLIKLFVSSSDPLYDQVIAAASRWIAFFTLPYILCGIFETVAGFLRGLGKSVQPMIITMTCACLARIIWVWVFFPLLPHEIESLLWCYPISYMLSLIAAFTLAAIQLKRIKRLTIPSEQ